MRTLALLTTLTVFATTACDTDPDLHHDLAPGEDVGCGVEVARISGIDGSQPVSPTADVLVELARPSQGWDAWIDGVPSVSVREPSGDRLVVRPDHRLEPGYDYTLWVRDCHGDEHPHDLPVGLD